MRRASSWARRELEALNPAQGLGVQEVCRGGVNFTDARIFPNPPQALTSRSLRTSVRLPVSPAFASRPLPPDPGRHPGNKVPALVIHFP